jgi:heme/copper-type cytochrome/quinol oxidase subunit 2
VNSLVATLVMLLSAVAADARTDVLSPGALPPEASYAMTAGGWVIMILSVGFVVGLLTWCVWKVISTPGAAEHLHSQADIETPDVRR